MNKVILLFIIFSSVFIKATAQSSNEKIVYIVDSIEVKTDPEKGDDIRQNNVSDLTVVRNKDSLKLLGYQAFDGAIYLFTKEYRNRPDSIKRIPSTKKMERVNGQWLLNGTPYSGYFIDYYYSGNKQGEGSLLNGTLNGMRMMYFQTGQRSVERDYKDGIANGFEKEYYEDGSLQQKGEFKNGKEEGVWEMYFPNGQVKQKSNFKDGAIDGETILYYSTGKILAVEQTKNGKTVPDKRLEKIDATMAKGHEGYKEEDFKAAIKYYSKTIELDSTYAEAYFARGTIKLNDFNFDEAIADFDMALHYEPYMPAALKNRAFARIRKYQFGSSRVLSKNNDVTVMASKDKAPMPDEEKLKICTDLQKAMFLGEKADIVTEAFTTYCTGSKAD